MDHPYGTPSTQVAPCGALSLPVMRTTTHALEDAETVRAFGVGERFGEFYQRLGYGNGRAFEASVATLEGADGAVAFASGMAAIAAAVLAHAGSGDRVLVAAEVYGGTCALAAMDLGRFGIAVERFCATELGELERALSQPARLVVVESPINPTLRVVDLRRVAALAEAAGAWTVLDGTFAPPPLQMALALGIDLVCHSATKFFGGHSDVLAGVVSGSHELLGPIEGWRRRTGAVLAPDPAWLLCRSMPTLALRVRAQGEAALAVARGLQEQADALGVSSVSHPSLPEHPDHELARELLSGPIGLVSFEVRGGRERAVAVFERLSLVARAASLGGVESLASLPAYTTHAHLRESERERAGIPAGLVRIAVGLEGAERILEDLRQALQSA